ncbi:hypothetical protein CPAR01_04407 [Colletotrichum paranaense]|uniref:Uncharacterized protein n=1 Tax=Colletotrichum paranaense TaxID=1914294 RepID=A0ABQ9SWW7_9PEZI|nr:uncharacterized protein CPAR01_04407 [Colletotrichum paranaense]KAK1543774.1 hypothetical protein CPAR01_04407 [Colletotrichum paranaense]
MQSSRAASSSMRKKRFLLDGPYSKDLPRPRRRMHIGRNPILSFLPILMQRRAAQPTWRTLTL